MRNIPESFDALSQLQENYIPDHIPCREQQIQQIISYCKAACKNEPSNHPFIFGPTGTGKTVSVRYVLNNVSESCPRALPIYINLKGCKNEFNALWNLAEAIGVRVKNGVSVEWLYKKFFLHLKKSKRTPIIAMDEIDSIQGQGLDRMLYRLLREAEKPVTYLLIANKPDFFDRLDYRVKSSLGCASIVFPQYNASEIFTILKSKCADMKVSDNALMKIAKLTMKKGDIRFAFQLLLAANKNEELTPNLVESTYYENIREPRWLLLESLGTEGMLLFACFCRCYKFNLTADKALKTHNNYAEFNDIPALTEGQFKDITKKMIDLTLIKKKRIYQKTRLGESEGYKAGTKLTNPFFGESFVFVPFSYDGDFLDWLTFQLQKVKIDIGDNFWETAQTNIVYKLAAKKVFQKVENKN